jgi:DNA primase
VQFGPEKIAEIRDRVDIVSLIGDTVALKRVGAQFRGLCPFHGEKTPSFYVHPGRQMFKCFGCQVAGDVISFVMRSEGRTFPEAIRLLAERAGVELPVEDEREEAAARQARQRRERLLAVTDAAAGFYLRMLLEHPLGKMALAEIEKRGVTEATRTTYRLGYAPAGWDALARFLAQKGYSPREAEEAGLLVPRRSGDGHYDRFRHRLMFPIADVHGHIVAFSGRVLPTPPGEPEPAEQGGKYVNSPEGPLYHKGELLFGIHEARVPLRQQGVAVLCEGNFDVLAVHQAGLPHVVAPLGTAFTLAQAKLLRRYVQRVVLLFDGDAAGRKAIAAAFPLLSEAGLGALVAPLPRGEDPDSLARSRGPEALGRLISMAVPAAQHLIDAAAEQAGADPAAKSAAIEGLGPVLSAVDNPVERQLYLERIAQAFGVGDVRVVEAQLRRGARDKPRPRAPDPAAPPDPRAGDPTPSEATSAPSTPAPALEKDLVGAYLDAPGLLRTRPLENVLPLLTSADLRAILRRLADAYESSGTAHGPLLMDLVRADPGVSPRARRWLEERLVVQTFDDASAETFLRSAVTLLKKQSIEREQQKLARAVQAALREGDDARAEELMRLRGELFQDAKKLLGS